MVPFDLETHVAHVKGPVGERLAISRLSDARPGESDHRQVTRDGVTDSVNGNRLIESREPAAVGGCERE